ncbi:Fe2+/Zn2+ uptake regulation protein [Catenovulum agarivorans DS-2]|uniref:Fe2+/Zn2+ uptake regulation protein n=1 Tax=Catenovulum agarivorans DS-2 TaxID=1328313 RepID=W7QFU7_9ALTE|nr:Fur family transcriptional regulator [Catenovulum agarivorans]EWH10766.1 Fe2+/Zn2+ uptake regulation protein [Catenovulum agarivorans DS-2]
MTLTEIVQQVDDFSNAHGVRLTVKRKMVMVALIRVGKAVSAYELIEYCKKHDGVTLPAISVYRILAFLQSHHMVHKLDLANKFVACSHLSCGHHHQTSQFLICTDCNKVEEIEVATETITSLQSSINKAGFTLASQQLEMHGVCIECSPKI